MKTLTIALCMLLVVLPAGAQQIAASRAPNFYVPYGVRGVPVDTTDLESSSAETWIADPGQRPNAPMPPRHPMHRPQHRKYGPSYRTYLQPPSLTTAAMIGGLVAVGLACLALATGDQ